MTYPRATGAMFGLVAASMLGSHLACAAGWETSVYVTGTSDYVHRGLSQTNGGATLQAGVDASSEHWFAGVWASGTDYPRLPGIPAYLERDVELVLYAGTGWELPGKPDWRIDALLSGYTYPGARLPDDDYWEWTLGATFRDRWRWQLTASPEMFGTPESGWFLELGQQHPFGQDWGMSWTLGRAFLEDVLGDRYWYGDVGVTRFWENWSLDARYHLTDPTVLSPVISGGRLAFAATFRF